MSAKDSENHEYSVEYTHADSASFVSEFQSEYRTTTKGPLSLLIQLTRMIRGKSFPLNPDDFLTENKGQVAGLGGGNLKKILGCITKLGVTKFKKIMILQNRTYKHSKSDIEIKKQSRSLSCCCRI